MSSKDFSVVCNWATPAPTRVDFPWKVRGDTGYILELDQIGLFGLSDYIPREETAGAGVDLPIQDLCDADDEDYIKLSTVVEGPWNQIEDARRIIEGLKFRVAHKDSIEFDQAVTEALLEHPSESDFFLIAINEDIYKKEVGTNFELERATVHEVSEIIDGKKILGRFASLRCKASKQIFVNDSRGAPVVLVQIGEFVSLQWTWPHDD